MPMWWDKKYGKNSVCAITHTRLRPSYSIFLPCKHGFCKSAFLNWVDTQNKLGKNITCPLCRTIVKIEKIL